MARFDIILSMKTENNSTLDLPQISTELLQLELEKARKEIGYADSYSATDIFRALYWTLDRYKREYERNSTI